MLCSFLILLCVYVCICVCVCVHCAHMHTRVVEGTCAVTCVRKSEDILESVLSSYFYVVSRAQSQVTRPEWQVPLSAC